MKKGKKIYVMGLLVLLTLGLCACGQKEETARDVATNEAGYTSAVSFEQEKGSVEQLQTLQKERRRRGCTDCP